MLTTTFLSGCVEEPQAPVIDEEIERIQRIHSGELPPQWKAGDAWTYRFNVSDKSEHEGPVTIAVTSSGPDGAELAVSDRDFAFFSARFHLPFHQTWTSNLSTASGLKGEAAVLFQWPLASGQKWTTRWLGEDVAVTVVGLFGGEKPYYQLTLVNESSRHMHAFYDYSPIEGAIIRFSGNVIDGLDPNSQTFYLERDRRGVRPDALLWRAYVTGSPIVREGWVGMRSWTHVSEEGTTDFWLPFSIGGPGAVTWLALRDLEPGQPATVTCPCRGGSRWVEASPGQWTWWVEAAGSGTVRIGVYRVDWSQAFIDSA